MEREGGPPGGNEAKLAANDANATKPKTRERRPRGKILTMHTWSRTSVALGLHPLKKGPCKRDASINLAPIKLAEGSLLTVILKAAPFPVHQTYVYGLRRSLEKLEQHDSAKEILSRQFSEVRPHDINELFKLIEDGIAESADINYHLASVHARALFMSCPAELQSGKTINQCGFKTRFKSKRPGMGSGRPLKGPQPANMLELVPDKFDSLQERNEKALAFGQSIRNQITHLCEQTLNSHDEVLATLSIARTAGLPKLSPQSIRGIHGGKTPHIRTLAKLSSADLLRVAAALVSNKRWALENRDYYFPFVRLTDFTAFCLEPNPYTIVEVLLSEYCLPRLVVTACAIALMAFTALNSDVIKSLTLQNVLERGNHILVVGIKGRSGQLMEAEFTPPAAPNEDGDQLRIDHPIALRAIKLLVANAKKVEEISGDKDVPLLNRMKQRLRYYKWEPLDLYYAAQEFWDFHETSRVSPADLRRLCAHIMLLSPGETIFSVQALLGHADTKTTIEYVNSNIIAHLLDANIRRFGEKLAATALFFTGRGDSLAEHGLTEQDVQPLLFPVSKFSNEKCAVDTWIDSNGAMQLMLGVAEFRQCATQYQYYQRNFVALMNENPRRFASVHLPRIFFCTAMRQVMLASPHAAIFNRFEEAAHEK